MSDNFKTTLDEYYRNHIGAIDAIAKNSGKTFNKKIIYQKQNEILYEWQFDNSKETEIARIVYTPKGIYHIHFAKKGAFTNQEKVKVLQQFVDTLKNKAKIEFNDTSFDPKNIQKALKEQAKNNPALMGAPKSAKE